MKYTVKRIVAVGLIAMAGLPALASGRSVHPSEWAENRLVPMDGVLPACHDPAVLGSLTSSFDSREAKFWGPLRAVAYDHVRPLAYRPWGPDLIPRRFCTGRMALNDGSLRRVDYSVRQALGLWGLTWDVNWCVVGLDRNRAYAPDCKMARP